jgi:hypothetical protein
VISIAAIGLSTGSAQASCAPPNANGVINSSGAAAVADSHGHLSEVCPPAWGQPVGKVTGRKVG